MEIVSIDEIVLKGVEVVSGERTLRGDIELVPRGAGVHIRRVALAADTTALAMTGDLTALAPLTGKVDVTAETLDIDRLIALRRRLHRGVLLRAMRRRRRGPAVAAERRACREPGRPARRRLEGRQDDHRGLVLSDFAATAPITPDAARFEPLTLGVFGGRYEGSMQLALGDMPKFQWSAKVTGIDAASLMAFAGSPDTITGKLSGTLALDGEGLQMEQALRTARGRSRIDITDGTIAGLQLVRTIVTATSGRGGPAGECGRRGCGPRDAGRRAILAARRDAAAGRRRHRDQRRVDGRRATST